jgi:hypothetical protein
MTEIFLVDLVSFVHLVYLVNEMNEKNQIDQTNEIGDFEDGRVDLGFNPYLNYVQLFEMLHIKRSGTG